MRRRNKVIITIVVGLCILLVVKSFYYSNKYGGTDLRCRIVGARLLTTDHSPYFYKWNPVDGERLLNPNDNPGSIVNGNVVTPAILYTIQPLAKLRYDKIRTIWTCLQFIIAAVSIWLLSTRQNEKRHSWQSPLLATLLAIVFSEIWLFNIERGQIYVLYVLFMALMYWCYTLTGKRGQLLAGIVGGIFLFFRPIAVLFLLPFLLKKRFQFVGGTVIGAVIGILLFVMPSISSWKDYYFAMNEFSGITEKRTPFSSTVYPLPATIEGLNNITQFHRFNEGGMSTISKYLSTAGIHITGVQNLILLAVTMVILIFLFLRSNNKEGKKGEADQLFLAAFLFYILAEVFIAAPRAGYNLVQWIFPVFISWRYIYSFQWRLVLFIVGMMFIHHFPFVFFYQQDFGEFLWIIVIGLCSLCREIYSLKDNNDY